MQVQQVDVASPVVRPVTVSTNYPATLIANRTVEIVGRVNGTLESMNYTPGSYVKAGQVLFTIESRNYRDAVAQAQANLANAKSNQAYAESHYKAMAEALKSDAVGKMEVEQAHSDMLTAQAEVRSAAAALQTAQTQLSYCTVRAPFDGHIAVNEYSVGTYIPGEGAPVKLTTIYDDHQMIPIFSVDDSKAAAQVLANMADRSIDYSAVPLSFAEPLAHDYTVKIDYLAPNVDTSTGTLTLQGVIDNPYRELRAGMYLTVKLPLASVPDAVLVKDASIGTDQLGKYLYVVNDSNRVVYTPISVGELIDDSLRIVTKGISPDQRYITRAIMKVRDGMPVKPVLTK